MTNIKNQTKNLLHLAITLAASLVSMQIFNLSYALEISTLKRLVIILSPVLFLYLLFSCFFKKRLCLYFILLTTTTLTAIANKKYHFTDSSLSWSDLTAFENFKIAVKYLEPTSVSIVIYFTFVSIILIKRYSQIKNPGSILLNCILCLSLLPLIAPMSLDLLSEDASKKITTALTPETQKYYDSYRWEENIRNNGILTHLIQTSHRSIPKESDKNTIAYLNTFLYKQTPTKNVIFILCESCWKDEKLFSDSFEPLIQIGMKEISAISPVYGGGTANAEFEMYTGLSSKSVLNGIIFQEYASIISEKSISIISNLQRAGYVTIALHDYFRNNWRRSEILPKLGFSKFISIEDMDPDLAKKPTFPDDIILYNNALKIINELDSNHNKFFLSLISVSTHGPYANPEHYKEKLNNSIAQIASFIKSAKEINSDTLFVVYGDHKPGLTEYFIENNIISSLEDKQDIIGKIPVFISSNSDADIDFIERKAKALPMYCLSAMLDTEIIKSGNPITNIVYNTACKESIDYNQRIRKLSQDLYWVSFFKK